MITAVLYSKGEEYSINERVWPQARSCSLRNMTQITQYTTHHYPCNHNPPIHDEISYHK